MQRNALLSVHDRDKPKLADIALRLSRAGFRLWASGGTTRKLKELELDVTDVAAIVGGEASEGHLVVTISREIALGLLQPNSAATRVTLANDGLPFFDLVCVTFYPIQEVITKAKRELSLPEMSLEEVRQATDVGGPNILHAAAKGRRIILSNPQYWDLALRWIEAGYPRNEEMVLYLAQMAEEMAGKHILASAQFMGDWLRARRNDFCPADISTEFHSYWYELHGDGTT